MTSADPASLASALTDGTSAGGPDLAAVFDLLSDETRLRIVRALDARRREYPDAPGLAFSSLRERAGVRDAGQFNYHLGRLRGVLVAKTDAGYVLTDAGVAIAALVADD